MIFTRKNATVVISLVFLVPLALFPSVQSLSQKNAGFQRAEASSRRNVLLQSLQTVAVTGLVVNPRPALALKERNEALCGTGFFTNIAQYMCTDIGDISDEGKSRKMTDSEMNSMDSLLGKLGAAGETSENEPVEDDEEKNRRSSTD